jgi:hypothetical protein
LTPVCSNHFTLAALRHRVAGEPPWVQVVVVAAISLSPVIFGGYNSKEPLKINASDNEREVLWRRLSLATVDLAERLAQAP